MGAEWNRHGARYLRLVPRETAAEDAAGLASTDIESFRHAARWQGRIGRASRRSVADAEGPDGWKAVWINGS